MPDSAEEGKPVEPEKRMSRAKTWAMEMRAPFLTASIIPVILGTAIAWASFGIFNWFYFILVLIGGIAIHIGTNVANDYFDHKSGTDEVNKEFVRPFTGGSRMIQRGLMTPREVLAEALIFFAIGAAIGLYLAWQVGWIILAIGIVGIFSGFFYTAPPVNLASRGIGELFVGLNFGILMTLGAFFVQTATLSWEPVLAAVPVALLIAALLYINQFQDYTADKAVGKKHLVVRLGKKRAVDGYIALMVSTYISVILFSLLGWISIYTLIILISLPLVVLGIYFAKKYHSKRFELAPANALTVTSHLIIGILLIVGYVFDKLGGDGLIYLVPTVIFFGLIIMLLFRANWNIERQKRVLTGPKGSAG